MCCGPYDYEYPMLNNSRYPRLNPEYGRVGSVFSDPNVAAGSTAKTNSDLPRESDTLDKLELDDPDWNLDAEPDSDTPPLTVPPSGGNIDTSAGNFRGWR